MALTGSTAITLILAIALSLGASIAGAQPAAWGQRLPVRLRVPESVAESIGTVKVLSAAVSSTGAVYIADAGRREVTSVDANGALRWRFRRLGGDSSELNAPYRIAARPGGGVMVLNLTDQSIWSLSEHGRFISRRFLPFYFTTIDNLVVLPGGELALTGVSHASPARGRAIHVFDRNLAHVRSFGPLPFVRDTLTLDFWGAGALRLSSDGQLLYTRRLPYHVMRYSPGGALLGMLSGPAATTQLPDDALRISRAGQSVSVQENDDIVRPLPAIDLGDGWLLSGRRTRQTATWDLFCTDGSGRGRLVGSQNAPPNWAFVVGVDRTRRRLWLSTYSGDGRIEVVRAAIERDSSCRREPA